MTEDDVVVEAVDIWESHNLSGDRNTLKNRFQRMLQRVVDKAVTASTEFHFATNRKTHTFTDSNSLVELTGNASDARDVYTILWGSTLRLLYKYDEYEKDVSFSGSSITGTAKGWVRREGGARGFPQIEIIGTVTSGDVMTYKYLRSLITFADWPVDWQFVLSDGILARANRPLFRTQYNHSLQQMKDFYEAPKRGGHMALPSPEVINANVQTNVNRYVG